MCPVRYAGPCCPPGMPPTQVPGVAHSLVTKGVCKVASLSKRFSYLGLAAWGWQAEVSGHCLVGLQSSLQDCSPGVLQPRCCNPSRTPIFSPITCISSGPLMSLSEYSQDCTASCLRVLQAMSNSAPVLQPDASKSLPMASIIHQSHYSG